MLSLSLLVKGAIEVVQSLRVLHTPMWQLHLGTAGWLAALARSTTEISETAEFDVSLIVF